jgi:hypothetical protein
MGRRPVAPASRPAVAWTSWSTPKLYTIWKNALEDHFIDIALVVFGYAANLRGVPRLYRAK